MNIEDVRRRVAEASRRGSIIDLTREEHRLVIDDVAQRWLGMSGDEAITKCRSGWWRGRLGLFYEEAEAVVVN